MTTQHHEALEEASGAIAALLDSFDIIDQHAPCWPAAREDGSPAIGAASAARVTLSSDSPKLAKPPLTTLTEDKVRPVHQTCSIQIFENSLIYWTLDRPYLQSYLVIIEGGDSCAEAVMAY